MEIGQKKEKQTKKQKETNNFHENLIYKSSRSWKRKNFEYEQ